MIPYGCRSRAGEDREMWERRREEKSKQGKGGVTVRGVSTGRIEVGRPNRKRDECRRKKRVRIINV